MASQSSTSNKVIIRSWPKLIFLWPTALAAFFFGAMTQFAPEWANGLGGIFLVILALNLVVITFDFPRSTSLTVFVLIITAVLALILINQKFSIIEPLERWVSSLEITASRDFYLGIGIVMSLLFVGMAIVTRFDYWVLTSNELIHYTGLLGNTQRFSTAGLNINTEVSDVFEFVLAGAGRIIITIPGNPEPVTLDNVPRISHLLRRSKEILSRRVVKIAGSQGGGGGEDTATQMAREYD
jgi:hypothetical protein